MQVYEDRTSESLSFANHTSDADQASCSSDNTAGAIRAACHGFIVFLSTMRFSLKVDHAVTLPLRCVFSSRSLPCRYSTVTMRFSLKVVTMPSLYRSFAATVPLSHGFRYHTVAK